MKKKSIWPYKETYKGHKLEVFKDGSVIVRSNSINTVDYALKDLTEAFAYIDKKEKMNTITEGYYNQGVIVYKDPFSLAPCVPQDCLQAAVPCQKGNNPMYVDNDKHIESSKINYLSDRASGIYYLKSDSLTKVFGFADDDAPATSQELVDRFVSGKFVFKDASKKDTKGFFYRQLENIRWRDPAVKEDQAGFDKAHEALKTLYQDTKDMIAIGTPADGLAAVKALNAWTPVVSPLSA